MRLHHVQVACPADGEDACRRFYGAGLGLVEADKPEPLRGRGGVWFRHVEPDGAVTVELHVGVEEPFAPARRAHPALLLDSVTALDACVERLRVLGYDVDLTERATLPRFDRAHAYDPHGNRVELLAGVARAIPPGA